MARKGEIEIPVAVDTGGVEKSIQNGLIDPIEDAEKALESLGKADAGEELEKDLDKAQRASKDLEDELEDARKELNKLGFAAKDAGSDGKRGLDKIKDSAGEVQTEIGSNLGEAVSSLRGDFTELGQVGQDTLGGLAASAAGIGGPWGLVAAGGLAAAAAAVGNITGAFEAAKEASDNARESAYEYGITVAESGAYADANARIQELTGSIEGLKQIQDIATVSGWDTKEVLTALATGDGLPALTKAFNDGANSTMVATSRVLELEGTLKGTAEGFNLATTGADLNASALYDLAVSAGTATGEVDAVGNAIYEMPDGKKVVVSAATQTAHEALDTFEKRKLSEKEGRVKATVNTENWDRWQPPFKRATVVAMVRAGRDVPV